jgi:hypothetical protein
LEVIGWAVFLGMSWTWCIGMFLPVLMVRQFGAWGWVAFAIPNVVGAAAMGWTLRDASASARVVANHMLACSAFSAVTIIFQISFVGWIVQALVGHWGALISVGVAVAVIFLRKWRWGDLLTGTVVLAISLSAIAMAPKLANGVISAGFPPFSGFDRDLGSLSSVLVLGFLLCPYLDLTFHRARQATSPRGGAAAFTIGFAGPFLLMIVFTLWYARLLIPLSLGRHPSLPTALSWLIAVHLAVQCGYTIGVHWRAMGWGRQVAADPGRMLGGLVGFAAALFPLLASNIAVRYVPLRMTQQELVYRLFLAFYGLIFPAYVWLCMIPHRGAAPERRQVRLFLLAILAAAPMYWLGFVEGDMKWLVPGVGVVLAMRIPLLFEPRRHRRLELR